MVKRVNRHENEQLEPFSFQSHNFCAIFGVIFLLIYTDSPFFIFFFNLLYFSMSCCPFAIIILKQKQWFTMFFAAPSQVISMSFLNFLQIRDSLRKSILTVKNNFHYTVHQEVTHQKEQEVEMTKHTDRNLSENWLCIFLYSNM